MASERRDAARERSPRRPDPLPIAFYERDAAVVARSLLGTYLVHAHPDGVRAGRIVETEAYRGPEDLACHARVGLTKRTRTLYGAPGHAYVFLIYGMYDCFNVVCAGEGRGHAVLVRAIEPLHGIAFARTDGPGRLTRAMAITRAHDGADLTRAPLFIASAASMASVAAIAPGEGRRPEVAVTARVGVAYAGAWADAPLRFYDAASRCVSRPSARQIGSGGARDASAGAGDRETRAAGGGPVTEAAAGAVRASSDGAPHETVRASATRRTGGAPARRRGPR